MKKSSPNALLLDKGSSKDFLVEAMGVEPMSEKRSVSVSPGAGNLQHSLGVTPVARLTLW